MGKLMAFIACALAGAATATAQPAGSAAEDDLAVVKRAVEKPDDAPAAAAGARRTEPARWFRVRIEEKGGAKVKVNLPLLFVRELDHHMPDGFDWGCRRARRGCGIRLSDVLDQLDAGQDLVEIKDANAVVRIWVE